MQFSPTTTLENDLFLSSSNKKSNSEGTHLTNLETIAYDSTNMNESLSKPANNSNLAAKDNTDCFENITNITTLNNFVSLDLNNLYSEDFEFDLDLFEDNTTNLSQNSSNQNTDITDVLYSQSPTSNTTMSNLTSSDNSNILRHAILHSFSSAHFLNKQKHFKFRNLKLTRIQ